MPRHHVTDADDPRLAPYRALRLREQPAREGTFVVESREVVRQVLAAGRFRLRSLLTTETARATLPPLPDDLDVVLAPLPLVKDVAGFDFHQGCVALAERGPVTSLADLLAPAPRRLLVLDEVTNPDNLGGIFRNAAAFGVDAVVLSAGTVDPLYRKAVRVSIGATTRIPFARAEPWAAALSRLGSAGIVRVALVASGGEPVSVLEAIAGPVALVLGNEGSGCRPETLSRCDRHVTIPMAAGNDSLNVAVACGIALHRLASAEEAAR